MIRLLPILLAGLLAGACTIQTTKAGPTYFGETRDQYRLSAIAKDPTDAGTREALNQWAARPEWEAAKYAVLASIPSASTPLEERFSKLSEDQQKVVLTHTSTLDGPEVSALVLRLSAKGGLIDEGIAALAGKQDAAAVTGLLELAASGEEGVRIAAIRALEPPDTALAREGLVKLGVEVAEPGAIREAALDVLAPYDTAEVRGRLMTMARDEDSAMTAFVLDRFDEAKGPLELEIALMTTTRATSTAAGVRLLNRSASLAPKALERFLVMVDPASFAADVALRPGRYEAGRALIQRGDARGGPTMVQLLDDDTQHAPAATVLDDWLIDALPALRSHAPALTTPKARAEAARLFARTGAPADEAAVAALADPAEKAALVAALARAPYGLFPDGKVTYIPATDQLGPAITATLHEVIAEGRKLRESPDDPVLAYIGAARAWLAGARSKADQAALERAASAANKSFAVWLRSSLKTSGTWHAAELAELTAAKVGDRMGVSVRTSAPPTPNYPGLSLSGDLACSSKGRVENESLPSYPYNYTVEVPNPQKASLEQQVNSFPYDKRTITDCSKKCYCYVTGEGSREWNFSCDSSSSGVGSCNCVEERKTYPNPAYENLVSQYNNTPDLITQNQQVPLNRVRVTDVTDEACKGAITFALAGNKREGQLSYIGERRQWIVHGTAYPVHPDGTRLPTYESKTDPGEKDNRKANLESALNNALADYRPSVADVRKTYAEGVKVAVNKADPRAARDALVWGDPKLVASNAEALDAFRAVFLSAEPTAFPTAWK